MSLHIPRCRSSSGKNKHSPAGIGIKSGIRRVASAREHVAVVLLFGTLWNSGTAPLPP